MGNQPGGAGGGQGQSSRSVEEKYFLQKVKLGQGSFGTVWRAVDRSNDKVVAIKQLDKATMPKRQVTRKDIEREVELMKAVRHDNITQLFDTFEDERSIYLALEYCDGGDFGDKVKERGMGLREEEAADWMAQICAAIAALHTKGICHRDIKPDNFMVSGDTLKLTDFGLALFLPRGKLLTDKCGTPAFMAPEQVQLPVKSRGYGFPCDMWAAGISMYMLMFGGRHPFLTPNNQLDERMLIAGKLDFREAAQPTGGFLDGLLGVQSGGSLRFSDKCREVISRMVQPNPASRLTAEDSQKDAWLASARARKQSTAGGQVPGLNRQTTPVTPQGAPQAAPEAAGVFPEPRKTVQPSVTSLKLQQQQAQNEEAQRKIRSLETKNAHLQNALITAKQAPPPKRGQLRPGLRARYYSSTYGWMIGTVQSVNADDGTYNLDVRQHAVCSNISPPDRPGVAEDVWPPGTWVTYESSTMGWLPGQVTGFNQQDGTYNLDLREHAAIDKIRARTSEAASPSEEHGHGGATPQNPMRTEQNQQQGPEIVGFNMDGSVPAPPPPPSRDPAGAEIPAMYQQTNMGRTSSQQSTRPPDGSMCLVLDGGGGYGETQLLPAIIEGYNATDGSYSILVDPHSVRRRQQARAEMLRAPKHEVDMWPAGTQVFYESSSLGTWLPAVIVSFNGANATYNLDVRENAAPERVRPR